MALCDPHKCDCVYVFIFAIRCLRKNILCYSATVFIFCRRRSAYESAFTDGLTTRSRDWRYERFTPSTVSEHNAVNAVNAINNPEVMVLTQGDADSASEGPYQVRPPQGVVYCECLLKESRGKVPV